VVAELQLVVVLVVTVKLPVDVVVSPFTVTEMVPEVAPAGTVTVSWVAVAAVTVANMPLNLTVLSAAVVLKLVPVMVIVVPTPPVAGVKLVMVGAVAELAFTVKSVEEVVGFPSTITVILPVVAPVGTVTVSSVAVAAVTVAAVPLNCTVLLPAVVLKLVPLIITVVPTAPLVGEKLVIVGIAAVLSASSSLQAIKTKKDRRKRQAAEKIFCLIKKGFDKEWVSILTVDFKYLTKLGRL